MRVFVVGGSGAIGRAVVPVLTASGHEVVATSRSGTLGPLPDGAEAYALDILDGDAVSRAVEHHQPDAIVYLATAIPHQINPRRIGKQFATTNRLRTEGTRNLLSAASGAGVSRVIAESLAYAYEPGDAVRAEEDPLWPAPPGSYAPVVDALREMEAMVEAAHGIVLRIGHIYGPGTIYAPNGSMTQMVRRGKVPIVGRGQARYSFVHVDDVATAVLAAIEYEGAGVFNIVDDDPLLTRDWLPWFADEIGGPTPKRVPAAIARLAVGPFGVAFMDRLAAASNARARELLRWRPRHASFRDGIVADRQLRKAA